jgi:HK97 family phage prohead protease
MPYYITNQSTECQGWAVVKADGEVMGCHVNKSNAVDQMVAISLAEGIEPGGERALPDNYRPALEADVPEGRACGNCVFYNEDNVEGDKAWCEKWDEYVSGAYYCNAWLPDDDDDIEGDLDDVLRQVDINVPQYVRDAAQRGLDLLRHGFGGRGLADSTIREARDMAAGQMSEDKVIRANAWAARHAVDLDAEQNRDPNHPDWPGPGAVAHFLWGINPTDPGPARRWLQRQVDRINAARNHMTSVERRDIRIEDFELRAAGDGMSFSGYAAVFNSPSQPLPFTEVIAPGAFKRTLTRRNNIRMLLNHDTSRVLGTTRSGTLRLQEDSRGLHVEADLPDTTYGRDLSVVMQRGDVDAMSFGFSVPPKGDRWSDDGAQRTLTEVRLHEVSVVTFPAYEATSANVRDYSFLASRYDADVDAIADAISALESGTLNEDQATLLRELVGKSVPLPDVVEDNSTNLGLLQKQLDLKKYDI